MANCYFFVKIYSSGQKTPKKIADNFIKDWTLFIKLSNRVYKKIDFFYKITHIHYKWFYKKADIFYKTFDIFYKSFGIGYKISNISYNSPKFTIPRTMHKNILFLDSWR